MNQIKLSGQLLAMSALCVAFSVPTESQATAGFARQTGQACASCHFQHYPTLNEFGRAFKAGGYTLIGTQGKIEGENLSLPDTLNAGIVMKARYQKSNGPTVAGTHNKNNGQLQFFDEMLLMVGGRVSENIGVQLELNLLAEAEPVVENFKMPFVFDVGSVKAGVVPFTTAGQGVAYGFELLNTGAVRGQRIIEHRTEMSAQQYIGTGSNAEGFAAIAYSSQFFANLSKWSPRSVGDQSGPPTANYFRLAATPKVGNWDLGAGIQSWSGSATLPNFARRDTKAWAVDGQAQGAIGAMPLGIYLSHANASGTTVGGNTNLFNANPNDKTATAIAAELGVMPHKAALVLAYRKGDNGLAANNGDNAVTVGASYQIVQNMQLQLNYSKYSGSAYNPLPANGDQLLTFMLFGAF